MDYPDKLPAGFTDSAGKNRDSIEHDIRIFVIGHKDFSLEGLVIMLKSKDCNYVVSCIEPGDACIAKFVETEPDVLLIQNEALKEPNQQFIQGILEGHPDIRILVFGRNMGNDRLCRLVRYGIHGYINERMNGDHIKHALKSVIAGKPWIERHIMERFIQNQRDIEKATESQFYLKIEQLSANLTRREIEILREVVKGLAIKQIAGEVHLSHQGVKMHLAKLFKKFNVNNRNQLILAVFDEISLGKDLSALLCNGLARQLGP